MYSTEPGAANAGRTQDMAQPRDLEDDLLDLVRDFKGHLVRQQRAGMRVVPGGPTTRPDLSDLAPAQPTGDAHDYPEEPPARTRLTLAEVRAELGDCARCGLSKTRNKIVFGVGAPDASLMFVGEAPGAEEDRRGEPFVGRAGQLLDKMIAAMGWTRDTVYIANVLKCRPPGNRDPRPEEVEQCEPFLAKQIEAIRPRIIVTLGRPAAHLLLRTNAPISALRGRFQSYHGTPVMPTFHPAFLLRSPHRKRDTWSDLKQVIAELQRLGIATPHPAET